MFYWLTVNAGRKSHEKRIPALIKRLCRPQLAVFFDALMAGDGTMDTRATRKSGAYSTTSKQLADDVQEIAVKLGYRTKLRVEPPGTEGIREVFRVLLSKGARAGGNGRTQAVRYAEHHSREAYTGKVYCFSVPTGVFVTRRNGVVAVQGNTAFASYTVSEAQVFKPERDEFDEIISMKLLTAMGYDGYKLRSKPLVIEDATLKLQGLEVIQAMGDQVEPSDLVKAVNDITGTTLQVSDDAPSLGDKIQQQKQQQMVQNQATLMGAQAVAAAGGMASVKAINPAPKSPLGLPLPGSPTPTGGNPGAVKPKPVPNVMGGNGAPVASPSRKEDEPSAENFSRVTETFITIPEFAMRAMKAMRKRDLGELAWALPIIQTFDPDERQQFDAAVSDLSFIDTSYDPAGLAELAACTMEVMGGHSHAH